ncbi:MAG: helix-turn-helix domain-containing protein [Vicinamibacteria bacterium]
MGYRGKSLKALRENKEIHLRRIANETRIGIAYLEDLEEERFDRFPGKFYFKSFVRAYARALELDPEEVLHDLQLAYEDWSGERTLEPLPSSVERAVEDGFFNRVVGYIRRAQEV